GAISFAKSSAVTTNMGTMQIKGLAALAASSSSIFSARSSHPRSAGGPRPNLSIARLRLVVEHTGQRRCAHGHCLSSLLRDCNEREARSIFAAGPRPPLRVRDAGKPASQWILRLARRLFGSQQQARCVKLVNAPLIIIGLLIPILGHLPQQPCSHLATLDVSLIAKPVLAREIEKHVEHIADHAVQEVNDVDFLFHASSSFVHLRLLCSMDLSSIRVYPLTSLRTFSAPRPKRGLFFRCFDTCRRPAADAAPAFSERRCRISFILAIRRASVSLGFAIMRSQRASSAGKTMIMPATSISRGARPAF